MDSVAKPKSTVVQTNGKDVTIKTIERINSINGTTLNDSSRNSVVLNFNSARHKLSSVPNEAAANESSSEVEFKDSSCRISNKGKYVICLLIILLSI